MADDVTVEIHYDGKFVQVSEREVEYVGGKVEIVSLVDVDRICDMEILDFGRIMGIENIERFTYLLPGMSLPEGLRTCVGDKQSLDMAQAASINKKLVVYFEHKAKGPDVGEPDRVDIPNPIRYSPRSTPGRRIKTVVAKSPLGKKRQDKLKKMPNPNLKSTNDVPKSQPSAVEKGKKVVDYLDPEVKWIWEDADGEENDDHEDGSQDSDWEWDDIHRTMAEGVKKLIASRKNVFEENVDATENEGKNVEDLKGKKNMVFDDENIDATQFEGQNVEDLKGKRKMVFDDENINATQNEEHNVEVDGEDGNDDFDFELEESEDDDEDVETSDDEYYEGL